MTIRLALSTFSYPWALGVPDHRPLAPMTLFDLLDRAQALSVPVVQIADNCPLSALSQAELERLRDLAIDRGIDVEVGTRGIAPESLAHQLDIAKQMGSPILRVVIDRPGERMTASQALAVLAPQRAAFEAAGVTLAIENHDHMKVAELAALVESLGRTWTGVCLDTVNSFGALEGPDRVIEVLSPYVVNLHIKDFTVRRATHGMGFTIAGAPAGEGQLDLPTLLAAMPGSVNISGVLEVWTPPTGELEGTIELENDWVERSIRHLQRLTAAA